MDIHTFYRPHRPGVPYKLAPQPMYSIRKPLAKRRGVSTSELPAGVLAAFEEIEAGVGNYTWAFDLKKDAESLQSFSCQEYFRPYPRPNSIQEAGTHLLAELFPEMCESTLELRGEKVCEHPFIGPRSGAGSVQTEAPHLIPRERWLEAYGFGEGWLLLVKLL